MKIQISYCPTEQGKRLGERLDEALPFNTSLQNLEEEFTTIDADVHVVIYESVNGKVGTIPHRIMDFLEQLDERIVLLIVLCPLVPDDGLKYRVERAVLPFLPDHCDYKGLFLCPTESPATLVQKLVQVAEQNPNHEGAVQWLEQCRRCDGHPNDDDLIAVCQFIQTALD